MSAGRRASAFRPISSEFAPYGWAPSTADIAQLAGVHPFEVLRYDGNVPADPPPSARPGAVAGALAEVNTYPHGGYGPLVPEIARYAGVAPENIVLGAGADDLILLCARAFAGPGDLVDVLDEPTYPMFRVAAYLAGAEVGEDGPALTFCCRPHNPTGALGELPAVRPLAVDEAYFEYAEESAVGELESGVVVIRTFSKAFGLAGARVGYLIADRDTAAELNARQAPAAVSTCPRRSRSPRSRRRRMSAGGRRAGAARREAAHARSRTASLACELRLRAGRRPGGPRRHPPAPGSRRTGVRGRHPNLRAESGGRRSSYWRRSLAPSIGPARSSPQADGGCDTSGRRPRLVSGSGSRSTGPVGFAYTRAPASTTTSWSSSPSTAAWTSCSKAHGDLETGAHHTAEDAALALGQALDRALADRHGIARYGDAVVPMDDALAKASIDLGGRPWCECRLEREPGLAGHVLQSLAQAGRLGLHVEATGRDEHHVAEAAFKAVGRALRAAVRPESSGIPSTKGVL